MNVARRIVSLVPSLTETVCRFGLRGELVGCTKFCVAPPGLTRSAVVIGGTKDPDLPKIAALKPTHVLVNEEENKAAHIAELTTQFPVFTTFPKDPADVPPLLRNLAKFLRVPDVGERHARDVEAALAACIHGPHIITRERRCLYFIWREPYMVAASDTYINGFLRLAGLANAAGSGDRYPVMTVEEMRSTAPDLLLLSSEPYPFRIRDAERLKAEWPDAPPMLRADGQLFSWFGTLAKDAADALARWRRGEDQTMITPFGTPKAARDPDFNPPV